MAHYGSARSHLRPLQIILLVVNFAYLAAASCECGYVTDDAKDGNGGPWLFTESIESNFHLVRSLAKDSTWARQEFNVTAADGRGQYGKAFMPDNVSIFGQSNKATSGSGGDSGLELRVGSALANGSVPTAEMDSVREDLFYGSYRAGMKLTDVNGTCAAFFWYFNDTQEIDMEFLSREFDKKTSTFPVNLVIQSEASLAAGFNAANTGTFKTVNLTFDPTAGFHEYRFDFLPGRVIFYADSEVLAVMNGSAVPTTAGHLILQHWSNGNPLWSGGPPNQDAFLEVSYVKAYFNSTDPSRESAWEKGCAKASGHNATCIIENVVATNASTGGGFLDGNGGNDSGARALQSAWSMILGVCCMLLIMNWL